MNLFCEWVFDYVIELWGIAFLGDSQDTKSWLILEVIEELLLERSRLSMVSGEIERDALGGHHHSSLEKRLLLV